MHLDLVKSDAFGIKVLAACSVHPFTAANNAVLVLRQATTIQPLNALLR